MLTFSNSTVPTMSRKPDGAVRILILRAFAHDLLGSLQPGQSLGELRPDRTICMMGATRKPRESCRRNSRPG